MSGLGWYEKEGFGLDFGLTIYMDPRDEVVAYARLLLDTLVVRHPFFGATRCEMQLPGLSLRPCDVAERTRRLGYVDSLHEALKKLDAADTKRHEETRIRKIAAEEAGKVCGKKQGRK